MGVTVTEGANATIPGGTTLESATSDGGQVPGVRIGYIDGGSDFQALGDADGIPVQGTTTLEGVTSSSATTTTVNDTASSTTLLAANANRVGWSIHNTSSAVLYVKLGATATATSFAARLAQHERCGQDSTLGLYRGIIDGIWASDPNAGGAVITEW